MISAIIASLIVNIHLYAVNNQLNNELSELRQMEFQTISKGYYSGHKSPAYYVIEDEMEWAVVWNQHGSIYLPKQPPPEVDFSNNTIIAGFMGEFSTGGYGIEIKEIVNIDGSVVVKVEKTYPGEGCAVTEAFTRPYHIVKTDKIHKEITFETVERTIVCP